MILLRSILRSSCVAFLALSTIACAPSLDLADFESVELQPALKRYAIAHRGSLHEGLPDNSLPALRDAIARGVQFLEVDVRQGRDGELFIFHDGSLQVENYASPEELRGESVQELSPEERRRVKLDSAGKASIPTLKEALYALPENGTSVLQLDLKAESDALLKAVIELLQQESKFNRAVIQIRSPARIKKLRLEEPRARIVARCRYMQQLDQAIEAKVEFVELERWITSDAVRKAHEAGIIVTLNVAAPKYDKPETWHFFRARGVDSLMTDHAIAAQE